MSRLPPGLVDRLPENLPTAARAEVVNVVDQLDAATSCVVTGSLVEGLGNAHSDVDFYLIRPAGSPARPVAIGIRGARYVDCEYLTVDTITQLADRLADSSATALIDLQQRDLDRYYRLAIGIPLAFTTEVADALRGCSKDLACERYADWSAVRAYQYLARAAVSLALERPRRVRLLLREAALWRASQVLAAAGEGYPSPKWTEAKAVRRFGANSRDYRGCLAGYFGPADDLATELARARARISPPAAVLSVMSDWAWTLDSQVELMADNGVQRLVLGGRSIGSTDGATGMLVAQLGLGRRWRDAVGDVAAKIAVPGDEVMAASFADMQALGAAGFLLTEG